MDHQSFLASLGEAERRRLTATSDLAGLLHLAAYLAIQIPLAVVVILQLPYWQLAILPLGIMHAFLFTLQHECTHGTPFRSAYLNHIAGQITGFVLVQPFLWFRYFHMAHHRHTNDPGRDPELSGLPKPDSWIEFALHLSAITYWYDKLATLFGNIIGTGGRGYIPKGARGALRAEAVLMLAGYALAGILLVNGHIWVFTVWLLPLAVGFPFLRLYLLAEHGRCPLVADMFENSRTTYTTTVVRFLAWNMPYHIEHHVLPNVPFHRLPEMNKLVRGHLKTVSDGYGEFTRDYVNAFSGRGEA